MATVRGIRALPRAGRRRPGGVGGLMGGAGLLALALSVSVSVSACSTGQVPAAPEDDAELVEGQLLYTSNCAQCHGPSGGGALGSKLNGGRLLERFPDPADQRAIIVEGRNQMPGFDDKFDDAEVDAVVRYTREIIANS